MKVFADRLIDRLRRAGQWPPKDEAQLQKLIRTWIAFRESDRDALRVVAGWDDRDREYRIDPLPEKVSEAFADFLFGEDLTFLAANDQDGTALEELVAANAGHESNAETGFAAELHRAEEICSSEGEVWWRIYVDQDVADHPLIEWHSRLSIAPLWVGTRLVAAAVVSQLEGPGRNHTSQTVWRHFEIHTVGRVEHVLFRGSKGRLGSLVDLTDHPETEELAEVWEHGLPGMLVGRVANKLGRTRKIGVSDYAGIRDFFLDLNEGTTIGGENMRLTAKKRVVVPQSAVRQPPRGETVDMGDGSRRPVAGTFDAGEDVLIADPLDAELGRDPERIFKVLEYSFDAEALIAYKRDLVETAVTRVGLTPQIIGVATGEGDGYAISGTALRLRFVPTTKAGKAKARPWKGQIPWIFVLCQLLDRLDQSQGGFGRRWAEPESAPAVEWPEALPRDEVEETTIHSTRATSGIQSVEQSVRELHPDWSDDQVEDEVKRIREDRPAATPIFGGTA